MSDLLASARRFLCHPRYPRVLILVACLLVSPSLFVGLQFDDYLQRTTILQSSKPPWSALNSLFIFMDGDSAHTQAKIESGIFPWYALPEGQVAFWRPLSALTHWLDYQLWPTAPVLMHLHSLFWFALLCWSVIIFYRQVYDHLRENLLPLAALAATLYCLDDARGFAVGWLSNRNGVMAAFLGITTLNLHWRWRHDHWRWGGVAAPLILSLALLAGESALAVFAYLLAFALFLDSASRWRRLLSLVPYGLIVVVWRAVYTVFGFGAWGASYIEPTREPVRFLQAVIERTPVLLLGQWALPPAEVYPLLSAPVSTLYWLMAVAGLGALGLILWLLRHRPLARFFTFGMVASALPPSASLPANRLLVFVGLGSFGMLTLLTHYALSINRTRSVRWLVGFHLFLSPLLLPLTAFSPALFGNIEPALATLPTESAFSTQTAIFVNAPSHFHIGYLPDVRVLTGEPIPARIRWLASGLVPVTYARTDSQTLIVQPEGGYLSGFETVFRASSQPLAVGQTIILSDVSIDILSLTPDQRPAAVAFHFHLPLDSPAYRWFEWREGRYVSFVLPTVSSTLILSPTDSLFSFLTHFR